MTAIQLLNRLATAQYGVFTRAQAKACGFSNKAIRHRLETGRWIALHPGIYVDASVPQAWHRDEIAACFWSRGVAAGIAAGFLFGLPGCEQPQLEVVTHRNARAMPMCGVIVRVTNRLPEDQITDVAGIPVTVIERTLLDLCGRFPRRRAAIAVDNALSRGLTGIGELDYCLFRTARQGRNGCAVLRDLVKARAKIGQVPTTPLETIVFEMLDSSPLDMPKLQHEILDAAGTFVARPDFLYAEEKLVIEAHSRLWHEGQEMTESDRIRENRIRAEGFDVMYVTWGDATQYADRTLDRIAAKLEERRRLLGLSERPGGATS